VAIDAAIDFKQDIQAAIFGYVLIANAYGPPADSCEFGTATPDNGHLPALQHYERNARKE
jgi:hypothetical protein